MEGSSISAVTELLVNILIGTFSFATFTWIFVGIQTFINDRREEKRKAAYHAERMKELMK